MINQPAAHVYSALANPASWKKWESGMEEATRLSGTMIQEGCSQSFSTV